MSSIPPVPSAQLRGAVDLSPLVNRSAAGAAKPAPATGAGPAAAPGSAGQPPAATGQPIPVPGLVLEGTDANFAQFLELSAQVPVVVDLWAGWSAPSRELSKLVERLAEEYGGRLLVVTVEVETNPQLAQAFQAQTAPTVAAIVGGRPIALFAGALPEDQVRDVFEQLLVLAAQNGVTGTVSALGSADAAVEPVEAPLPPHHAEAYAAIELGDYELARAEYRTAIAQDPRDALAVAGLAQVSLLARLQGRSAESIRSTAASAPQDPEAQLAVADLDVSGGHIDDAFDRLLSLFPRLDPAGKDAVRTRLLEYFEVVGVEDARVIAARRRLTMLLY